MNSSEPPIPDAATDIHLVDDTGAIDGTDQASKLARCQEIIEYQFKDESLLLSALTHASGAAHRLASNERLEFLGDAILGLVVAEGPRVLRQPRRGAPPRGRVLRRALCARPQTPPVPLPLRASLRWWPCPLPRQPG